MGFNSGFKGLTRRKPYFSSHSRQTNKEMEMGRIIGAHKKLENLAKTLILDQGLFEGQWNNLCYGNSWQTLRCTQHYVDFCGYIARVQQKVCVIPRSHHWREAFVPLWHQDYYLSHYGTKTIICPTMAPRLLFRRRMSIAERWQLASRRSVLQISYQQSVS